MIKTSKLPSEYQEVEYIESTGTQWINTGVSGTPTSGLKTYIDAESVSSSASKILVSGDGDNGAGKWFGATTVWTSGTGSASDVLSTTRIQTTISFGTEVSWDLNGVHYSRSGTLSNSGTLSLLLNAKTGQTQFPFIGKLYSCKIWNNNELIRDFVPCYRKSDNEVGLYDLANNVFYTNQGTDAFLKGNDVAPTNMTEVGFIKTKHNGQMANIDHIMTKENGQMVKIFEQGFTREQEATTLPMETNTKTIGKDLKQYLIYGNSYQRLPQEYQQVEYIETTNTQIIETNLLNGEWHKIKVEFSASSADETTIVGGDGTQFIYVKNYEVSSYPTAPSKLTVTQHQIIDATITSLSSSAIKVELPGLTYQGYKQSGADSKQCYILAMRKAGGGQYIGKARLYYCEIYDNSDTLIRNFIPCYRKSDNEIGLYDLVNGVFYANAGTGTFLKGADVVPTPDKPIEIESVGDRTKNLFSPDILSQFTGDLSYLSSIEPTNDGFKVTLSRNTSTSYTYLIKLPLEDGIVYSCDNTDGTIEKTGTEWRFFFAKYQAKTAGTVIYFHKVQKEKGTTPTPYEPYGYKIPVEVKTVNIFNINAKNTENGYVAKSYIGSTGNIVSNNAYDVSEYMEVESSSNYIYSINGVPYSSNPGHSAPRVCFYDKDKTFISATGTAGSGIFEFVTPSNCKYIRVPIYLRVTTQMITKGTGEQTVFVPYFNETKDIYLNEPLRKIGDYADYIDYKNQKVVRNIGAKNLNGTESWSYFSSYNCYYVRILDMMVLSGYPYGLCNRFISGQRTTQGCIQFGGGNDYIYIHDDNGYADTTLFKNWLVLNNTDIVYPLETTTEESITLPSISTVKGEKSIFDILTKVEPSKLKITYKGE